MTALPDFHHSLLYLTFGFYRKKKKKKLKPLMIMLSRLVPLILHLVKILSSTLIIRIWGFINLAEQNARKNGNFSERNFKLVMLLGLNGSLVKTEKKKKMGEKFLVFFFFLIPYWTPKFRIIWKFKRYKKAYHVLLFINWYMHANVFKETDSITTS